ncbi:MULTISPECIES: hypothetical protein [unclassified Streptomyces]|uniref:hypothetical protein n=1 Tax=unclassified Streptomyces TaxID=2593676 RepID=UPI003439B134
MAAFAAFRSDGVERSNGLVNAEFMARSDEYGEPLPGGQIIGPRRQADGQPAASAFTGSV